MTPSMVVLLNRGSVPRICTYCPSPSLRCNVTPGMRPSASAMFAFGRLMIVGAVITFRMFAEVRCSLSAIASPLRAPWTVTFWLLADTANTGLTVAVLPAMTVTDEV